VLPLLYTDLPNTSILVSSASLRPAGLDITITVNPGNGQGWTIQKKLADILALDAKIREGLGKYGARLIPSLPEGRIWKDRAPVRVDERKVWTPDHSMCISL
jgi:RalA-binding protein 1